jgi:cytochrome c
MGMGGKAMRFSSGSMIIIAGLAACMAAARAQEDPNRAQFLKSCGTCHASEAGAAARQGPNLLGVLGRKAGALEGFKYSDALKSADWVWDEAHLDKWIENAQAMRPGVVMPYHQADPAKRAKVIEFLKTLKRLLEETWPWPKRST